MIHIAKDLEGYAIAATDGDIGVVRDLFFDDDRWVVRYLVVDTGGWFSRHRVLVSPYSVDAVDHDGKRLVVSITRERVRSSPDVDTHKPVSRQHEREFLGYYGYPTYWGGSGLWGDALSPQLLLPGAEGFGSPAAARDQAQVAYAVERAEQDREDPHLRSHEDVRGYHVMASDGEIGHVHGMLVEDGSWAMRYLIADTSNWWIGHKVLISPSWIAEIRWESRQVVVNLARQAIQEAPPYDGRTVLDRAYEASVFRHYGRAAYWPAQPSDTGAPPP